MPGALTLSVMPSSNAPSRPNNAADGGQFCRRAVCPRSVSVIVARNRKKVFGGIYRDPLDHQHVVTTKVDAVMQRMAALTPLHQKVITVSQGRDIDSPKALMIGRSSCLALVSDRSQTQPRRARHHCARSETRRCANSQRETAINSPERAGEGGTPANIRPRQSSARGSAGHAQLTLLGCRVHCIAETWVAPHQF